MYLYIFIHRSISISISVSMCNGIHIQTPVCIRVYTRIHTHTHTHTRLFTIVFASPIVLILEVQGLLGLLELRACRFVFVCLGCLGLWDGRVEGGDCRALGDVFQVRTVILAFRIWGLGLLIWVDASC